MSTVPSPLISTIDSYYAYVLQQMAQVNPARVDSLLGVAEATDWPQIEVVDGGIYLLHVGSSPVSNKQSTEFFTLVEHTLQWVWLEIGTDIQPGEVAQNRGDRYRTSLSIFEDLTHASYPGFCGKAVFSSDGQGNVTAAITSPLEMVRWTGLRMRKTQKTDSGILYGVVTTDVTGYEQMLTNVDAILAFPPMPSGQLV